MLPGLNMGRELAAKNAGIWDRIFFVEHDFFPPQPVHADAYFFRYVLHNWTDNDCIKIVRALLPSMKNGVKALLNEGVLPEPPNTKSCASGG